MCWKRSDAAAGALGLQAFVLTPSERACLRLRGTCPVCVCQSRCHFKENVVVICYHAAGRVVLNFHNNGVSGGLQIWLVIVSASVHRTGPPVRTACRPHDLARNPSSLHPAHLPVATGDRGGYMRGVKSGCSKTNGIVLVISVDGNLPCQLEDVGDAILQKSKKKHTFFGF